MASQEESDPSNHDPGEGVIGDEHEYTPEIQHRANEVIRGNEWPINDVDLSKVIFRTNTRTKRSNGRARPKSDGRILIEVAEYVIEKAGWDAAEQVIRHELIHVWQCQYRGETVELPNGSIVEDVDIGHTGSWYEWEELLEVSRTNRYYDPAPSDFNYVIKCRPCGHWIGRYRLCRFVRLAAAGRLTCPDCSSALYLVRPADSLALEHGNYDDAYLKWFVSDDFEPGPMDSDYFGGGD